MFKFLMGAFLSYGVFNEKGREFMNDLGNGIIKATKNITSKGDKINDNKSSDKEICENTKSTM